MVSCRRNPRDPHQPMAILPHAYLALPDISRGFECPHITKPGPCSQRNMAPNTSIPLECDPGQISDWRNTWDALSALPDLIFDAQVPTSPIASCLTPSNVRMNPKRQSPTRPTRCPQDDPKVPPNHHMSLSRNQGPLGGCPYHKSPTIWGLYSVF